MEHKVIGWSVDHLIWNFQKTHTRKLSLVSTLSLTYSFFLSSTSLPPIIMVQWKMGVSEFLMTGWDRHRQGWDGWLSRLRVPYAIRGWWQPEIRDQLTSWGKGSWNSIIYRVSYISGGCLGFQPSTILRVDERSCFSKLSATQAQKPWFSFWTRKKTHIFAKKTTFHLLISFSREDFVRENSTRRGRGTPSWTKLNLRRTWTFA